MSTESTPLMQIGWVLGFSGLGASLFSRLPSHVAGWAGVGIALVGIATIVVGARLRDGRWLADAGSTQGDSS